MAYGILIYDKDSTPENREVARLEMSREDIAEDEVCGHISYAKGVDRELAHTLAKRMSEAYG